MPRAGDRGETSDRSATAGHGDRSATAGHGDPGAPAGRGVRSPWLSLGEAFDWVAELVAATAVWAVIGYGADRVLGTWPALFVTGTLLGHATGIYMLWRRSQRMIRRVTTGGTGE